MVLSRGHGVRLAQSSPSKSSVVEAHTNLDQMSIVDIAQIAVILSCVVAQEKSHVVRVECEARLRIERHLFHTGARSITPFSRGRRVEDPGGSRSK